MVWPQRMPCLIPARGKQHFVCNLEKTKLNSTATVDQVKSNFNHVRLPSVLITGHRLTIYCQIFQATRESVGLRVPAHLSYVPHKAFCLAILRAAPDKSRAFWLV